MYLPADKDIMTQADFVTAPEMELQLQAVPFDRAALDGFVASCWPLMEDDPDAGRWAREFVESGNVRLVV